MSRYTKTQVTQLSANEQAAINNINKNFDDIETAIKDTVSRSGNTPTHMTEDLDMNGKRIINLPAPKADTDPVRRQDVVNDIALVQSLVNATTNAAAQTLEAAASVQEIIQDANVGFVADDLALGENSKIRICGTNIDDITTVAGMKPDINTVVASKEDIEDVADNLYIVTQVANNKTNINTVASNISNVNTVAGVSTDVTTVAGVSSNVTTVAGNTTNINTCASNISAITGASTQAANAKQYAIGLPTEPQEGSAKHWAEIAMIETQLKTGMLIPFAGNTAPSGWLICDGSAISRTTYADLFAVIGTTYGAGDGSTTFNIPNLIYRQVDSTVAVKGTGMSLGMTDGTNNFGTNIRVGAGSASARVFTPDADVYGSNNGTSSTSSSSGTANRAIGVTTDATKSGMVTDFSSATTVNMIIKY